ncbi:MAG TPA: hypothetical protein VGR89_09420 [Puia sp.]|nr:hypothetical protein [Puia sp.]
MASYDQKDIIYESQHFFLTRAPRPFVSREEGGHMRIFAKRPEITERRDFTPEEAVDFIWLSSAAGEALEKGMNDRGVKVLKINFEELGNWPFKTGDPVQFHEHIFGRAEGSKHQVFPEAVQLPDRSSGFYEGFEPLDDEDKLAIKTRLEEILNRDRFTHKSAWHL